MDDFLSAAPEMATARIRTKLQQINSWEKCRESMSPAKLLFILLVLLFTSSSATGTQLSQTTQTATSIERGHLVYAQTNGSRDQQLSANESVASESTVPSPLPSGSYLLLRVEDAITMDSAVNPKESHAFKWFDLIPAVATTVAALAWPLAALFIVIRILKFPDVSAFLARVPGRIMQVGVAGLEIKLSEGASATVDDVEKLLGQIPATHAEWLSHSHLSNQFQLVVSDIKKYLTTTEFDCGAPLEAVDFAHFRFTLHVPDVLLENTLRQLVDYVGNDRGKGGRSFSVRRGIVGKAWRLRTSQFLAKSYTEEELVELWGMTWEEAIDTSGQKSTYLAVFIKSTSGIPLAVLYADSNFTASKLFGRSTGSDPQVFEKLERKVSESCDQRKLRDSLEQLELARKKVKRINLQKGPG